MNTNNDNELIGSIRICHNCTGFFFFCRCIGDERCDRKRYPVKRTYSRQGYQGESHPRELLQQSDRTAHRTKTEVRYQ